jgi:hypothetical protein
MDLITSSKNRCCIILLISFLAPFVISSDVDFSKIPQCAIGGCFPYHSSSIGCTQLTTSCFCDALAPINCASKNCTGDDWYAMEDWFATQCPNPPNVTLSGLPECSRACFRSAIIPTYCEAQITRTCFCRLETEFEGMSECLNSTACDETATDANNTLVDYYRETCVYDPTVDGEGGLDGDTGIAQGDQVVNAPSGSGSSLDKLALGVGLASGFVALVGAVVAAIKCLHRNVS